MASRYFEPDGGRCKKLMSRARKTNAVRDEIEAKYGHASPSMCPMDVQLRTVLTALFCGIERKDWDIIAEGAAMLQDAELIVRTEYKETIKR